MTWMGAPKECALNSIRARQNKSAIAEDYKRIWLCHVLNSKLKGGGGKNSCCWFLARRVRSTNRKIFEMSAIVYCFCHLEWLAEIAVVAAVSVLSVMFLPHAWRKEHAILRIVHPIRKQKKIINSNMSFRVTILYYNKGKLISHT